MKVSWRREQATKNNVLGKGLLLIHRNLPLTFELLDQSKCCESYSTSDFELGSKGVDSHSRARPKSNRLGACGTHITDTIERT